ncbi:MAG: hypothetical protein ACRCTY_07675, partial [Candidatus Adiutrix sp.]
MEKYEPHDNLDLSPSLVKAISENFSRQQNSNEARIKELRRYASCGCAQVFDAVPTLLALNTPDKPGYVDHPNAPFGLRFGLSLAPASSGQSTWGGAGPAVESLLLIGSLGSVGHTAASDLDYWVCYDGGTLNGHNLQLFQQKLALITAWAQKEHDTEANFYLVNVQKLLEGQITHLNTGETEGDVAPMFLLEELYRTMVWVSGRKPLWLGTPLEMGQDEYKNLAKRLIISNESP